MTSWQQQFIPNFAELAKSLYKFKRKIIKFVRAFVTQDSYEKLKQELMKAPLLAKPVEVKQLELFTDASSVGLGACWLRFEKESHVHHEL